LQHGWMLLSPISVKLNVFNGTGLPGSKGQSILSNPRDWIHCFLRTRLHYKANT